MEAENQQAREIIQPLLDTENGFVKVRCWTLCHLCFSSAFLEADSTIFVVFCIHIHSEKKALNLGAICVCNSHVG